jgi:hypothetical protein
MGFDANVPKELFVAADDDFSEAIFLEFRAQLAPALLVEKHEIAKACWDFFSNMRGVFSWIDVCPAVN